MTEATSKEPSPALGPDHIVCEGRERNYLLGWKLHALTVSVCVGLFLANLEISIVSTSLVAITDDLKGFEQGSWIVTSYLLTYTGLLIIWAKLSDIFGRKSLLLTSLLVFTVFSGACGAAQSITQLIALRAFQGIGASGIYSIVLVIFYEMVPSAKYPAYTAVVAALFTVSLLLGPLLGGLINVHTTWRWVFLLNVPAGAIAMIGVISFLPNNFPNHGRSDLVSWSQTWSLRAFNRVDFLGSLLLLSANALLVAALEQAAEGSAWSSLSIITCLAFAALLWPSFVGWEFLVSSRNLAQEPVVPWRFFKSRVVSGLLLNTFLMGVLFTVCVIQIPLKFQAVNGASPLNAGIHLLPYALACPTGSIIVAILTNPKRGLPPIFMFLVGASLQVAGIALMSTIPTTREIWPGQHGYEFVTGLGVGISIGAASIIGPFTIQTESDLAVIAASVVQFRVMGGAMGLALVTCVTNPYIKRQLSGILTDSEIAGIFESIATVVHLQPAQQERVRTSFAEGFSLQMKILVGFGAAQYLATALMWQKNAIRVK